MHPKFASLANSLHPSLEKLTACEPHTGPLRLPLDVPKSGVYLFSEGNRHLYVGRTDRLRARHREHWAGKVNDAPFAFKLARYATNNTGKHGRLTRKTLYQDADFLAAFRDAQERIARMHFRWVEERDAYRQCLLEIYTTVVLDAEYNDFANH